MSLIGAVEAGGTKFVLAVARDVDHPLDRHRISTDHPTETLRSVREWFALMAERHGPIAAFGIGSFGPIGIDPAKPDYGTYLSTVKPGWKGASLTDALRQFGVPVAIDTDVNAAALAEALHGVGRGRSTIAYTTVGTGIGTGVVSRGRVLVGESHFETGHFHPPRDPARDPFEGVCGYHGDCLEGLASGPAIERRWGHDLSHASAEQIDLIASYLAHLAGILVGFHRPELMVFGGGVMHAPGLIERLRVRVAEGLAGYLPEWSGDLTGRIVLPQLGDDAGITGALELGRRARDGELL
ncbi:ROK family protein [Qipengyuania sp.]|uniref:ROK family protein n=1 Tax=Qipengyuania sp. TaxID=2004515 RepID=UPI0035C7D556